MHHYRPSSSRYQDIIFRRCGRSGLQLPAVSLGLWHNFGAGTLDAARTMVRRAFDLGITHFDLANNYGPPPGAAEETLGALLREEFKSYRDELLISTKAGHPMWPGPYGDWGSRKYLIASVDQSLRRMGLDYVDIFYHHRPDPETPLEETMGALAHIVSSGKALYVGLSKYPPELALQAFGLLKAMGVPCVIHQSRYNMLERQVEGGLLPALSDEGVGFIAYSPLAQGILTNRYLSGQIPSDSRAAGNSGFLRAENITPERLVLVRALEEIALARRQTIAQLALSWVLRRPEVTSVLVGASKASQIEEAVAVCAAPALTQTELNSIEALLQAS